MATVAGAVLAAGSGVRMGTPKGELVVGGMRLVDRAVAALRDGGCDPVLAVVRGGVVVPDSRAVVNPDPDRGMRSSLALAVEAAGDADALAVLLADVPGQGAAAVRAVLSGWQTGRIAVARYADGSRGHPIVMPVPLWRHALASAGPDAGARALLADRADLIDEVDAPGDPADLDTPADLAAWARRAAGPS